MPNSPQLTARDRALFLDFVDSRAMTLKHVSALHFAGATEAPKKRIRQLKQARYLRERAPTANCGYFFPPLLLLDELGFRAIADEPVVRTRQLRWKDMERRLVLAYTTLAHELEVVNTKVAFVSALREVPAFRLETFSSIPPELAFTTEYIGPQRLIRPPKPGQPPGNPNLFVLKPDAFAHVRHARAQLPLLFFEVDRSTEPHTKLEAKAWGYYRYLVSGTFAKEYDGIADASNLRVVFVLANTERRNNVLESFVRLTHPVTKQRLDGSYFYLTTQEEFVRDPLGSIYLTPPDYAGATAGTPYGALRHKTAGRDGARDALIAARSTARALFAEEA